MKGTVAQFLKLYEAPNFPFRSLTTASYELNLTYVTALTGDQFLAENNVSYLPHYHPFYPFMERYIVAGDGKKTGGPMDSRIYPLLCDFV